jgi:hypothetical protein
LIPNRTARVSHFDQPNILAHVRFDERTDADGKKRALHRGDPERLGAEGEARRFRTPADRKRELAIREAMGALGEGPRPSHEPDA